MFCLDSFDTAACLTLPRLLSKLTMWALQWHVTAAVIWSLPGQVASMRTSELRALNLNGPFGIIDRRADLDVPGPLPPQPTPLPSTPWILEYQGRKLGYPVKPGTELRILCVGDSITVGFESDQGPGADGNGYRLELRNDLSRKILRSPSLNNRYLLR